MFAPLAAAPAEAFPEGAPWDAAEGNGCAACHFDGPVTPESDALAIEGLPERITPGRTYELRLRLEDDEMTTAGFLVSFRHAENPAGETAAGGERVETMGAMARSTAAGAGPTGEGRASWRLSWRAPDAIAGAVRIRLWGNAGNGDASPFGDRIHRRTIIREPVRSGVERP